MTRKTQWLMVLACAALLLIGGAVGAVLGYQAHSPATATTTESPNATDIGFAQDMAAHHQQALLMSQAALANTSNPAVRSIALQILLSQSKEQGTLQGWLSLWNAPQLASGPPMAWMHEPPDTSNPMPTTAIPMSEMPHMPGMDHTGGSSSAPPDEPSMATSGSVTMPGMASEADLQKLYGLRGADFDALFCDLMIRHHQGGVLMAQAAVTTAHTAAIRNFAYNTIYTQQQEIGALRAILAGQ